MNCTQNHIPKGSKKRPGRAMTPKHLTIHSTANLKSSARDERSWLTNPGNDSSTGWHIAVDEREAIEAIPLCEMAYHAGDGSGPGNTQSVGLEICESGDREKTLENAMQVSAATLKRLGLNASALRQHHDWSGKNCPRILRDTGRWNEFCERVKKEMERQNPDNTPDAYARTAVEKAVAKGILRGDDRGNLSLHAPVTRQDLMVILERCGVLER